MYGGFIPKYSALTNRMNSLQKVEKFVWTEDMEKDFLEFEVYCKLEDGRNYIPTLVGGTGSV